jgi:serine/threonine protein kinase
MTTGKTAADKSRYIVVDLMNGGDLRFHISRKTFTEEAVRFWIAQLGCAVRYIHEQGIVHRDIKPDNVLLDSDGHVHLADFVSSVVTPTGWSLTPPERRLRFYTEQGAHEQVWNPRLPGTRSIRRQGVLVRGRLVVTGRALLRVHIQQAALRSQQP